MTRSAVDPTRDLVFISYRRAAAATQAGRLADELKRRFGDDRIFHDIESILPGEPFPERLRDGLSRAKVVLVLMSERWCLHADEWGQRRIDDAEDYVRIEVLTALDAANVTVVPLLLEQAQMPPKKALKDLAALSERNAMRLRAEDFDADLQKLVGCLTTLGFVPVVPAASAPEATRTQQEPPDRLLHDYLKTVVRAHKRLPSLFAEHMKDVSNVYVELEVLQHDPALYAEPHEPRELARGSVTLRELLSRTVAGRAVSRWAVLGEPGAGKTTLARHLVRTQAEALLQAGAGGRMGADARGPIPVYATLPELAVARQHPFDFAEERLRGALTDTRGAGLRRLLEEGRPVWLLLDGLDEVAPEHRPRLNEQLLQWAEAERMQHVTIVLLSRPVGYSRPSDAFRAQARIQRLSEDNQKRLLSRWLKDAAQGREVWARLQTRPGLRDACRVPLLLSLLALLFLRGRGVPVDKRRLYSEAIGDLLKRGHSHRAGSAQESHGVKNASAARTLLSALSLKLQESSAEVWSRDELENSILELRFSDERLGHYIHPEGYWASVGDFLTDVGDNSGILEAQDDGLWRFLHRQFRELLAAEALHQQGRAVVLARARVVQGAQIARWAEVLGFACELDEQPLQVLEELGKISTDLALRVLPEVEGVEHAQALTAFVRAERTSEAKDDTEKHAAERASWDGDYLVRLFERWRAQGGFDAENVSGWLWQQVSAERSTDELAALHYALEHLQGAVPRERFFKLCERWPAAGPPAPEALGVVAIPAGEFTMGSPDDEERRFPNEGPQHRVELSAFWLGRTAVTQQQYAAFEPDRAAATEPDHPVVNVSWWAAYLFCRWAGGQLPTEAQWEYACRAGTSTRYHSGDTAAHLAEVAWFDENSEHRLHAVGEKAANAFGLHDMHGNVWEWCSDWLGEYARERAVDPRGPDTGSERVLRGGSWINLAGFARSASRYALHPELRFDYFGFRFARGQE